MPTCTQSLDSPDHSSFCCAALLSFWCWVEVGAEREVGFHGTHDGIPKESSPTLAVEKSSLSPSATRKDPGPSSFIGSPTWLGARADVGKPLHRPLPVMACEVGLAREQPSGCRDFKDEPGWRRRWSRRSRRCGSRRSRSRCTSGTWPVCPPTHSCRCPSPLCGGCGTLLTVLGLLGRQAAFLLGAGGSEVFDCVRVQLARGVLVPIRYYILICLRLRTLYYGKPVTDNGYFLCIHNGCTTQVTFREP